MRRFDTPVVFVGGSIIHWQHLNSHLKHHPDHPVIAVDGGGNALVENSITPQILCGDFDSVKPEIREALSALGTKIIPLEDQNYTDFHKALEAFDAPVIYGYGFLDGRIDHALDALSELGQFSDRRVYLIGMEDVAVALPPKAELAVKNGARLSFWSAGESEIIRSSALAWPIDGFKITAAQMSISNQAQGEAISIEYIGDPLIVITAHDAIQIGLD